MCKIHTNNFLLLVAYVSLLTSFTQGGVIVEHNYIWTDIASRTGEHSMSESNQIRGTVIIVDDYSRVSAAPQITKDYTEDIKKVKGL